MARRIRGMYVVTGLVASGLLLMACSPKAPEPEPEPEPAPAPVVTAPPKPQAELPTRSPGLWQLTLSEEGSEDQARTMRICTNADIEKKLGITGEDLSGDKCERTTVSKLEDGSWGFLAECNMGTGGLTEMSGKITGDYTRDYSLTVRSQTSGAAVEHMNRVVNLTIKAKRQGPCRKDQEPGDVILPTGEIFNLITISGES
ncbi:MAG: hypothetical protein QM645_00760 [Asticcacaulis sp.]